MKNSSLAPIFGLTLGLTLLAAAGCNKGGSGEESGLNTDAHPQETEWKTMVDKLPFPLSGDGAVTSISVGGSEYNGNYANRGDVEVFFDQDAEVITVEMRFYDFSDDVTAQGDETVEGTFERMQLWAFVGTGNPSPPDSQSAEDNCSVGTWKDGCTILSYYKGQTQPVRSGADIRVHLPKKYRGELNVETEDNQGEPDFPRVGNVTVDGLCGSGTIQIAQGTANVKMCRELTPAPTCSAEAIKECENFKDENGKNAAWSNLCTACPAAQFGQLRIEAVKPWAGNITVDIPTTTWLNANLANEETDKPHDCKPRLEACTNDVCKLAEGDGYSVAGEFNYPSPAAASGAGYNLTVKSAGCNPVEYFENEDAWDPDPTLAKPKTELHGIINVCTGCL
jgi:hypothetical protein